MTTTAGKWFEIDSRKGQVYLVGAATRELAFEYHDKGYIALEANLGFENGKTVSFLQGGNTVTATDDENGFSEVDIGKYIYTGDGWHKILSIRDVPIRGCGKNLWNFSLGSIGTYWIIPYLAAGTYTMSMFNTADWWTDNPNENKFYVITSDNSALISELVFSGTVVGERSYATFEVPNGGDFRVATYKTDIPTKITDIQLELGSTATAFEPYQDIPFISIDNTQGEVESVAVEAGCRARQAGNG